MGAVLLDEVSLDTLFSLRKTSTCKTPPGTIKATPSAYVQYHDKISDKINQQGVD